MQTPGIGQLKTFPEQVESLRMIGIPVRLVQARIGFPDDSPDEQQLEPLAKAYGA